MKFSILVLIFCIVFNTLALAEDKVVCITEKEAVDLIAVLDGADRDLELLDMCQKLVKDLYSELDARDIKVETLTKELITAKQDSLSYRASSRRWRTVAIATTATSVILIIIQVLPAL